MPRALAWWYHVTQVSESQTRLGQPVQLCPETGMAEKSGDISLPCSSQKPWVELLRAGVKEVGGTPNELCPAALPPAPVLFREACYRVQAHAAHCTTGQYIKRHVVGERDSDFIQKASKPRRWWTSVPKNHLTQVRIQASFILKGEGCKVLVQVSLPKGCVHFFLSAAIHRWAWSGCFL